MKVKLLREFRDGRTVPATDHAAGKILSVPHFTGRNLLYNRGALWISQEDGDPLWTPPQMFHFKMTVPSTDKMHRGAMNR